MDRRWSVQPQPLPMAARGVPEVRLEAVAVVDAGVPDHPAVTRRLGQDRRRHDLRDAGVAVDLGPARRAHRQREAAVDQHQAGRDIQPAEGTHHRQQRRVVDIDAVDLLRPCPADGPRPRVFADQRRQLFAGLRVQYLGVVQTFVRKTPAQDHRRSGDRSCQRPSSRLVDSADDRCPLAFDARRPAMVASCAQAHNACVALAS